MPARVRHARGIATETLPLALVGDHPFQSFAVTEGGLLNRKNMIADEFLREPAMSPVDDDWKPDKGRLDAGLADFPIVRAVDVDVGSRHLLQHLRVEHLTNEMDPSANAKPVGQRA